MFCERSRPTIEYPCSWSFRLISTDPESTGRHVEECLAGRQYELRNGRASRKGNYQSLELALLVQSEEDRDELYRSLSGHASVRSVF